MRWARAEVSFRLIEDTSDPVTTIEVTTPSGTLLIMSEPRENGRILIAAGVHISSREPDTAAKSYLTVIDHDPELVEEALASPAL